MNDLGEFEGLPITGHALALKGTGDGLSKAVAVKPTTLHKGDTVDLLVRARAGNVLMREDKDNPDAWIREQSLMAETITIVEREFSDSRIEAQREANDKAKGIVKLPFPAPLVKGDVVHTDESGNVLTDAEVAERRGHGQAVVEVAPAVVVYTDGSRAMWPDEYPKGAPRPAVGDGGPDGVVEQLLDHVTGEPIGVDTSGDISGADTGDGAGHGDGSVDASTDTEPDDFFDIDAPDVDPAILAFLEGSVGEVKMRVRQQLSRQMLEGALAVEQSGPNRARPAVVTVIEARLVELAGE